MSDDIARMLGTALVAQVEETLRAVVSDNIRIEAKIIELESTGKRIVDGGQISDGDEEYEWEFTDHRTGEVLATGKGDKPEWTNGWFHIDAVWNEVGISQQVYVEPLPLAVAEAVSEWAEEHEQEARAWLAEIGKVGDVP
jgi:hypothetical protein